VPCHAMLCCVTPCYDMICYVVPCCSMLCYAMLCYAMLCYAMLCYAMLCYAVHAMPWECRVPWGQALLSLEPTREEHDPTTGQVLTRGLSARVGIFHGPITRLCPHPVTGKRLPNPTCFCCCYRIIVTACGRLGLLVLYIWPRAHVCGNVSFTWVVLHSPS